MADEKKSDTVKEIRDWLTRVDAANKRDKDWKKEAKSFYDRYDNEKSKDADNSVSGDGVGEGAYNLLYSNTSILQPTLYSTTPNADVRRRFRDEDPLGKLAAKALERSLDFTISASCLDDEMSDTVFDMLIAGRGVARVKYKPTIDTKQIQAADGTMQEFDYVVDERVVPELVPWDKFKILDKAKRWNEVTAICFEHDMTKDELVDYFGEEIASKVKLNELTDDEMKDLGKDTDIEKLKTATVYEIWDKDEKEALFISPTYKEDYLLRTEDPLHLQYFWPVPRPMYYVNTTKSLVPVPLTRLYRRQLRELDHVTVRISKVTDAMRIRGLYPSNITEIAAVAQGDDNDWIPVENASAIMAMGPGGLERAIWVWPIEKLPGVLQQLYVARDQIKQSIYEIIGISDILRGATKASETLGAQQIKAKSGSIRISRAQKEVARFVRDLLNMMSEIMVDRFSEQTFAAMTNMQLPTADQVNMAKTVMAQTQQTGQPPSPKAQAVLAQPSWNDVMGLLKDDKLRSYRVDIETDSTISDQLNQDMADLAAVLQSIGQVIQGAAPAVQSGILPAQAVIEIILAIARHARLGSAIEDAIEEHQGQGVPMLQQLGQAVQQLQQQVGQMAGAPPGAPPGGGPPPPGPGGPPPPQM